MTSEKVSKFEERYPEIKGLVVELEGTYTSCQGPREEDLETMYRHIFGDQETCTTDCNRCRSTFYSKREYRKLFNQ